MEIYGDFCFYLKTILHIIFRPYFIAHSQLSGVHKKIVGMLPSTIWQNI